MATIREVKAWLNPLLQRHEDLALVGRLLIVKPVHHHLRAVLIDRTSSANRIQPTWFINHLCDPRGDYHISWGDRLSCPGSGRLWKTEDAQMPEILREQIEKVALPILRSIVTFEDYLTAVSKHEKGHLLLEKSPTGRVVIDIAMGQLDAARALCKDQICEIPDPAPNEHSWTIAKIRGAKTLCKFLAHNDRHGLIRTLHEWEAATASNLKIAQLWEPTPFPIELKA